MCFFAINVCTFAILQCLYTQVNIAQVHLKEKKMTFLNYSKNFKGVADVFLHNPERYLPFTQLLDAVMSGKSELSHAHKEMIATYSSYLNARIGGHNTYSLTIW